MTLNILLSPVPSPCLASLLSFRTPASPSLVSSSVSMDAPLGIPHTLPWGLGPCQIPGLLPSAGPAHCPANLACSPSHSKLWMLFARLYLSFSENDRTCTFQRKQGPLDRNSLSSCLASWELIHSGSTFVSSHLSTPHTFPHISERSCVLSVLVVPFLLPRNLC